MIAQEELKIRFLRSISPHQPGRQLRPEGDITMTAPIGRRRARVAAVFAGTALAVVAAGAASAQPTVVTPGGPGGQLLVCTQGQPAGPPVLINPGPGPHIAGPAQPLPPGVDPTVCPDIEQGGPVIIAPGQPGGPHVIIERHGPGGPRGVIRSEPAHIAPTGSSGS
jgi:hypothetical protein